MTVIVSCERFAKERALYLAHVNESVRELVEQ